MSSAREDQGREVPAQDELLARYQQASALDDARPGAQVRAAALAHARAVAAASAPLSASTGTAIPSHVRSAAEGLADARTSHTKALADAPIGREASNRPSWRVQALGSLAVIGLVGLLYMQFDRGSEEEREAAFGTGTKPTAPRSVSVAPVTRTDVAPEIKAADTAPRVAPSTTARAPSAAAGPARPAAPAPPVAPRVEVAAEPAPALAPAAAPAVAEPALTEVARQALARDSTKPAAELAKASAAPVPPVVPSVPLLAAPAAAPARLRSSVPAPAIAAAADAAGSGAMAARSAPSDRSALAQALRQAALAGDVTRIEGLLAQGGALESVDEDGRTPLLLAVMQGQRAAVARLLAAGANARAQDRDGVSALRHAQSRAFVEIEALLRQHGAR